ncbi:MAG: thiamine-phosphate kinase [Gammaproteobacteria bacterium]|nr:thiamine-phosphate kinase [Gammaproteobacteria bacterium]
MDEFTIIRRYFTRTPKRTDVVKGIGDDAAVVRVPLGFELVVSTDTLVESVHFPREAPPRSIGHKALTTSLSDLAAMGADPAWFTLNLTLPEAFPEWLLSFSQGLFEIADTYPLDLVGGNLSRGPLCIATQVLGLVPSGRFLSRSGAAVGDKIYVSGTLGNAGHAFNLIQKGEPLTPPFFNAYYSPTPRLALGKALRGVASAAIDISDGLILDMEHLAMASGVEATLIMENLPISSTLKATVTEEACGSLALFSGGDYELLFTVPPHNIPLVHTLTDSMDCPLTLIGEVTASLGGVKVIHASGEPFHISQKGFQHF